MTRPRRLLTALLAVSIFCAAVAVVAPRDAEHAESSQHAGSTSDDARGVQRAAAPGPSSSTFAIRGRRAFDAVVLAKRVPSLPAGLAAALVVALVWLGVAWLGGPSSRGTRRRSRAAGRAPPHVVLLDGVLTAS